MIYLSMSFINTQFSTVYEFLCDSLQRIPGVVRFIKAADIPGANNYMIFSKTPDEVFP